jgi:hypothetical protein
MPAATVITASSSATDPRLSSPRCAARGWRPRPRACQRALGRLLTRTPPPVPDARVKRQGDVVELGAELCEDPTAALSSESTG